MARLEGLHVNPGGVCTDRDVTFGLYMEERLHAGVTPELLRVNIRHACPDRLDALEAAFDTLGVRR